ncbi:MAG: CDP-diacylglycerol--glycerol-3-phosphate 3-phosphatidyltransferase [Chlamydiia bacterium]|nr:CDP-diacylglycerol--glycerol-3-phosphate 3-phosphatidyltransferase [Chlamydiia bacterium]
MSLILVGLFILCELSDIFDGIVARKFDQVTDLGKVLDPMSDSLVRVTMLLGFTQGIVKLPLMLVLIFLFRDVMISTLRTLCALRGTALAARMTGKLKAVIQAVAIGGIISMLVLYSQGWIYIDTVQSTSFYLVLVAAVYTLFSGLEYLWANRTALKEAWV